MSIQVAARNLRYEWFEKMRKLYDFTFIATAHHQNDVLETMIYNLTKGTGIADTRLNGSGNYQQRFVNADDYRAQEFPDGSPTTINTYYLRLIKA